MLTGLPQVHFQMLFSHLVASSVLARQKIKFYSLLPGQLGSFPRLCYDFGGVMPIPQQSFKSFVNAKLKEA